MLGVDRLDMIKGIPQKLLAFEKFLEENPEWRDKVLLVQIAVPSRTDVPDYQASSAAAGAPHAKYGLFVPNVEFWGKGTLMAVHARLLDVIWSTVAGLWAGLGMRAQRLRSSTGAPGLSLYLAPSYRCASFSFMRK